MTVFLSTIIFLLVFLLPLAASHLFDRGYEAGRREQRRIINRAMDETRRQGLAAQQAIDYLYEQAKSQIDEDLRQRRE